MITNFEILIVSQNGEQEWKSIKKVKNEETLINNNGILCNSFNGGALFNKKQIKDYVSIYRFNYIDITVLRDRRFNPVQFNNERKRIIFDDYSEYNRVEQNRNLFINFHNMKSIAFYLLYLFSDKYLSNKYLIIKDKIIIKNQYLLKYFGFDFIYKNKNYIIKNDNYYNYFSINLYIIYEILYLNDNNNVFYGDKKKISIIEYICKKNYIEYDIYEDRIKIFVICKNDFKYIKDEYFEGYIYDYYRYNPTFIKIGRYVMLLTFKVFLFKWHNEKRKFISK